MQEVKGIMTIICSFLTYCRLLHSSQLHFFFIVLSVSHLSLFIFVNLYLYFHCSILMLLDEQQCQCFNPDYTSYPVYNKHVDVVEESLLWWKPNIDKTSGSWFSYLTFNNVLIIFDKHIHTNTCKQVFLSFWPSSPPICSGILTLSPLVAY